MDHKIRILRLTTKAAAILMPLASFAQAPPQTKTPVAPKTEQLDPKACAESDTRSTVGQGDSQAQRPNDKSLSNKLARSDGVICPPSNVDPEIKATTPPGGAMPVIPPPGSSGGDQSVQPK